MNSSCGVTCIRFIWVFSSIIVGWCIKFFRVISGVIIGWRWSGHWWLAHCRGNILILWWQQHLQRKHSSRSLTEFAHKTELTELHVVWFIIIIIRHAPCQCVAPIHSDLSFHVDAPFVAAMAWSPMNKGSIVKRFCSILIALGRVTSNHYINYLLYFYFTFIQGQLYSVLEGKIVQR